MNYEWDSRKAKGNVRKHGINFEDAATVLSDDCALTIREDALVEERFVSIGLDALARVLVVVYTYRGENVRLISARKANRRELKQYRNQL